MYNNILLGIIICLLTSSCSIVSQELRGIPDEKIVIPKALPINVFVEIKAPNTIRNEYENYKLATQSFFNKNGVNSNIIKDPNSAALKIVINRKRFRTLPQEWLTGLSFGLIPSGGTRYDRYVYSIEYLNDRISIHLDETTVNHLIFTPICFIQLPFVTEIPTYKMVLSRYISVY